MWRSRAGTRHEATKIRGEAPPGASWGVLLHGFGAHSLDVLVYFFLAVSDWAAELVER